ncbi:MAG: hypothetical protein IT373_09350, partial [Polyangiaceae bacterium]|nr:hypothetical protein [Polyangiaceae bacterium]
RLACLALLLCPAGCSDDGLAPLPPGVEAIYAEAPTSALTPYPSDRYTRPDATSPTGLRVDIGPHNTVDLITSPAGAISLGELVELDGFSTTGGVAVMFDGPIELRGLVTGLEGGEPFAEPARDAASFRAPGAPLLLVDVDPASPERGTTRGLVPRAWEQAQDAYYLADEFTLIVEPATPLRERTRYLFVVTDALRARDGGPVRRSALTQALLDGAEGSAYGAEVSEALEILEAEVGLGREHVVLATAFTTESVTGPIAAMARAGRLAAPPVLLEPFTEESSLAADGRVRFRAVYAAPEYRALSTGTWQLGPDGAPVVQGTAGLEVFLAFSNALASGPRPIVIYQHGLGGDKDGSWGTAERLAALDVAVVSIDSPHHGSRAADPGDPFASIFAFFGIDAASNSFVIGKARDNFRQMASDQLELVRLLGSLGTLDLLPLGAPDGVPDLDPTRIAYIGHSFGSVEGATIFALAPELRCAVWNVGGAGLMALLRDSKTFGLIVDSLRPPGVSDGAVARFMAAAQAIVDPGDPLDYARYATGEALAGVADWSGRDVLLQEVVDDNIVPNSTSSALARAAGLPLLDPVVPFSGAVLGTTPAYRNLAAGGTGGIVQFTHMDDGAPANHGELIFSDVARAQYVRFFEGCLAGDHATIEAAGP